MLKKISTIALMMLILLPTVFAAGEKETSGPRTVTIDVWTREGEIGRASCRERV